jgi:hypothetical protein
VIKPTVKIRIIAPEIYFKNVVHDHLLHRLGIENYEYCQQNHKKSYYESNKLECRFLRLNDDGTVTHICTIDLPDNLSEVCYSKYSDWSSKEFSRVYDEFTNAYEVIEVIDKIDSIPISHNAFKTKYSENDKTLTVFGTTFPLSIVKLVLDKVEGDVSERIAEKLVNSDEHGKYMTRFNIELPAKLLLTATTTNSVEINIQSSYLKPFNN